MKLLLRVVKSSQVADGGAPVAIDNTVHMPIFGQESADENEMDFATRRRRETQAFDEQVRVFERQRSDFGKQKAADEEAIAQQRESLAAEANVEAEKLLAAARVQAVQIIAKAENDGIAIKANAKATGFTEGFTEGRNDANEKCDKYVKAAAQFLGEINDKKDAYYARHEGELTQTLLTMVKKLTIAEIKSDEGTIFRIVKEAAKGFRNSDYIKLTFAGGDVSREIVTDKTFLKGLVGEISDIEVEILEEAESGTVMLDNGKEIIDASVPTQLEFLKEIMKGNSN